MSTDSPIGGVPSTSKLPAVQPKPASGSQACNPNLFGSVRYYLSDSIPFSVRIALDSLLLNAGAKPSSSTSPHQSADPPLNPSSPSTLLGRRFNPDDGLTHFVTDSSDVPEVAKLEAMNAAALSVIVNKASGEQSTSSHETNGATPNSETFSPIEIVSPSWITRSWDLQTLQPPGCHSPSKALFFSGLVFCTSDLPESDSTSIQIGVQSLGGQYRRELTREVTHLFVIAPRGTKYEASQKYGKELGMVALLPHWFEECLKLGCLVPMEAYMFPDPPLIKLSNGVGNATKTFEERMNDHHKNPPAPLQTSTNDNSTSTNNSTHLSGAQQNSVKQECRTSTALILGLPGHSGPLGKGMKPANSTGKEGNETYQRSSLLQIDQITNSTRTGYGETSSREFAGSGAQGPPGSHTTTNNGTATAAWPSAPKVSPTSAPHLHNIFNGKKVYLASNLALRPGLEEAIKSRVEGLGATSTGGQCWSWSTDADKVIMDGLYRTPDDALQVKWQFAEQQLKAADIVLCKNRSGWEYWQAYDQKKIIGNLSWMYYVLACSTLSPPLDRLLHYPLPPDKVPNFVGWTLTISNYSGPARDYVRALIECLGGTFDGSMSKNTAFVVTPSEFGNKVKHARSWDIPCVTHLWLEACVLSWSLVKPTGSHLFCPPISPGINFVSVLGSTPLPKGAIDKWAMMPSVKLSRDQALARTLPSTTKSAHEVQNSYYTPAPLQAPLHGVTLKTGATIPSYGQSNGGGQHVVTTMYANGQNGGDHDVYDVNPAATRRLGPTEAIPVHAVTTPFLLPKPIDLARNNIPSIQSDVRQAIRQDVLQDVRQDIRQDARQDVRQDVPQGMRQVVHQEIPQVARQEVPQAVRQEVRQDMRQDVYQGVRQGDRADGVQGENDASVGVTPNDQQAKASSQPKTTPTVLVKKSKGTGSSPSQNAASPTKRPTTPSKATSATAKGRPNNLPLSASRKRHRSLSSASSNETEQNSSSESNLHDTPAVGKGLVDPSNIIPSSGRRAAADIAAAKLAKAGADMIKFAQELRSSSKKRRRPSISKRVEGEGSTHDDEDNDDDDESEHDVPERIASRAKTAKIAKMNLEPLIFGSDSSDELEEEVVVAEEEQGEGNQQNIRPSAKPSMKKGAKDIPPVRQRFKPSGMTVPRKTAMFRISNAPEQYAVSSFDNPPNAPPPKLLGEGKPGTAVKRVRILATGLGLDKTSEEIKALCALGEGTRWSEKPPEVTHLVVKAISRTEKFLSCLSYAPKIVTREWVDESIKAGKLLDETDFLLRDKAKEKELGETLEAIINRAKKGKVFDGYTLYLTPKILPDVDTLNRIITCAGGVVNRAPLIGQHTKIVKDPRAFIVSCSKDRKAWDSLAASTPRVPIYSVEAIFQSIMHQRAMFRDEDRVDLQIER